MHGSYHGAWCWKVGLGFWWAGSRGRLVLEDADGMRIGWEWESVGWEYNG
jgi:hypothetical protein